MSESNYSRLTREEVAEMEVGKTTVSRSRALVLVICFILTVVSIPFVQHTIEIRAGFAEKGHWVWPKAYSWMVYPGQAWEAFWAKSDAGWWARIQTANGILMRGFKGYEKDLEDDSFLAKATIPHSQALTAEFLGLGNEQVYLGRDGWLFYQPEVDYLTGSGFLDHNVLRSRSRSGDASAGAAVQPNPVKAIVHFRDQLKARGIRLLLFPAPVKPMIEPERLSTRYGQPLPIPLQNPSYKLFLQKLEEAGVDVLDVSEALAEAKEKNGEAQFLLTDTHWNPKAMELAAGLLAEKIKSFEGAQEASAGLTLSEATVDGKGDIAAMLKLPDSSRLYPAQKVVIHPVKKSDGTPFATDPAAEVLVLGDSFSNIYSLEAMGWGGAAGMVEQVAYALQQPVDAILRNDAGAFATRELLAKELAQGRNRLAGKKILVWEFAMRELAVGDWKIIELKDGAAKGTDPVAAGGFYVPADGSVAIEVEARVLAVSKVPRPGTVPYKDQVFAVHLGSLTGPDIAQGSQALVYLFGMKDNVLTPASEWKPGDQIKVSLRSWNDVASQYDRFNRSELDDSDLQLESPAWGEPLK